MVGARHLSTEIRHRIVAWHRDQNYSVEEIAALAHCSERTVWDVLRYQRMHGTPHNVLAQQRSRPRTLAADHLNYMVSLLQTNPTLYLDEISESLFTQFGLTACISTISRSLRRLAITHKALAREALERNELLRATWQAAHAHIPMEYFLWLDESSVDNLTNYRQSGWSPMGQACVRRSLFLRGQRYSILPALTTEGIVAMDILEGSVTKEKFLNFIKEQLVRLPPLQASSTPSLM